MLLRFVTMTSGSAEELLQLLAVAAGKVSMIRVKSGVRSVTPWLRASLR